jgi:hypothetical protein
MTLQREINDYVNKYAGVTILRAVDIGSDKDVIGSVEFETFIAMMVRDLVIELEDVRVGILYNYVYSILIGIYLHNHPSWDKANERRYNVQKE